MQEGSTERKEEEERICGTGRFEAWSEIVKVTENVMT